MWISVVGYEGIYEVSYGGQIRRVASGPKRWILKSGLDTHGYPLVRLRKAGVRKRHSVHRLVTAAFIGPCPIGKQVNHKDGNKTNNTAENLEYLTPSQNVKHAFQLSLMAARDMKGERGPNSKLTQERVDKIRSLYSTGSWSKTGLGELFGVSRRHIGRILSYKNWGG